MLANVAPQGHNFWSKEGVKPVEPAMEFKSVREAIEHFGGQVWIIPEQTTPEQ